MQEVVKKPIFAIPHLIVMFANPIHGICDPQEVLEEPEGNVLIHGIVIRQNQRNLQHVLAVERHPGSAVGLIQMATRGKGSAAIKDPDVVQSEKATGEDVL